ncbi:hypothetical protein [Streptomyces sp. NPDC102487]|uniref:hypothetical protein n=1 Tax=Streptomyces sp. NPDC102487 TaxID=3366182 RepID=UPI003829451C
MSLSRPVKFLLLFLLAFVGGTLYLHFGKDQDWSDSPLLGLTRRRGRMEVPRLVHGPCPTSRTELA